MNLYQSTTLLFILFFSHSANGLTFVISPDSDIVGTVQTAQVKKGEALADIGRKFDLGIYEMIEANPNVDAWVPPVGKPVIIPTQFILPSGPRKGMVINLAEMRIYYYHPGGRLVTTHPIGIGKKGWNTPLGRGKIIQKKANPTWRPPKSIRDEHARNGDPLPRVVPPGPKNPLGKFAMRLSIPGYLIHGTNRPGGIGVRSSSGCIRMYPEDIQSFFGKVPLGTPVRIIHAQYKFGIHKGKVYLEAHEPLSDPYYHQESDETVFSQALEDATMDSAVDLLLARKAVSKSHGYPTKVN